MTTLIFDIQLDGHHLEYIHHLYLGASERKDRSYVFAVPEREWSKMNEKRYWPHKDNIKFYFLDDDRCREIIQSAKLMHSLKLARLVKEVVRVTDASEVFLVSLAGAIPFLPLIMPKGVKISGIIYKIFLRAKRSLINSIADRFRYKLMALKSNIKKVYILNDPSSANRLNEMFHSDKFATLADPVPVLDGDLTFPDLSDIILPGKTVYLHFGAMDWRKGSLEILKAIILLPQQTLSKSQFIFAGKIKQEIKKEFNELLGCCRHRNAVITVEDEFLPYERLIAWVKACDALLAPYLLTDLSSGVIGYGALLGKPVIAPKSGLIGELVTENKLGVTIDTVTPKSIATAIQNTITNMPLISIPNPYVKRNTIEAFQNTILG